MLASASESKLTHKSLDIYQNKNYLELVLKKTTIHILQEK